MGIQKMKLKMRSTNSSAKQKKSLGRKYIFVFEGIDGSGKKNLIDKVFDKLKDKYKVEKSSEPLDKSIIKDEGNNSLKIALYIADRYNHIKKIMGSSNEIFLISRYLYSTLAYQGQNANTCELKFIDKAQIKFRRPDLIFYIKTPIDKCFRNQNRFSLEELQKIYRAYDLILVGDTRLVEIDGSLPIQVQVDQIVNRIKKIIK